MLVTVCLVNSAVSFQDCVVRLPWVNVMFPVVEVPLLLTASLINTSVSVLRTVVRLIWVLHLSVSRAWSHLGLPRVVHRGVSRAGDCIFNNHCYLCVQDCCTTTQGRTPWCFMCLEPPCLLEVHFCSCFPAWPL